MVKKYLDEANNLLEKLISITQEDIENIKVAKHDGVAVSVDKKTKIINEFQLVKKQLDDELIKLNNSNAKGLSEALDDLDKEKLELLKKNLENLHKINKEYAKFVLIVKDFYDGLLDKMFNNGTNNAYGKEKTTPQSLFKINV